MILSHSVNKSEQQAETFSYLSKEIAVFDARWWQLAISNMQSGNFVFNLWAHLTVCASTKNGGHIYFNWDCMFFKAFTKTHSYIRMLV